MTCLTRDIRNANKLRVFRCHKYDAAIFTDIRDQVAIEIEFPGAPTDSEDDVVPSWRERVLLAYRSSVTDQDDGADLADDADLPDVSCADIGQWEMLVNSLADSVLWDRDYEFADSFLDIDPGVSHHRRKLLGISDDYFTSVAPDPKPDEVDELIAQTRDIVRSKPR